MAQASDVLAVAVKEIGTVEQSGNRQKYGTVNVTVTVAGDGNHTAPAAKSCTVTCDFVSIYGVSWDGTATTTLSRTDKAADFTELFII